MNSKYKYRLFGCRVIDRADVFFITEAYDESVLPQVEEIAGEAGVKRFAYTATSQPRFFTFVGRAHPNAIVALDEGALKALGKPALVWKGVYYYALFGGYVAVLPPGVERERLVLVLKRLLEMKKIMITRRIRLLYALARRRGARRVEVNAK